MNKKLVLSVLSTAVVASMAASAMAKPNAGFYVGGNVDKYYSIDAFINHLDTALDEILDNLDSTTFVDENGKAAPFLSALNAQTEEELNAVTESARLDHFEKNPYTIVDGTGSYNPEEDEDLLPPVDGGELKVESVSAINKTTVKINFNKAVDTVTKENFAIEGATVNAATLSEDKKSVTLTVSGLNYDTEYTVVASDILVDGKPVDLAGQKFKTPAVTDLYDLELTTDAPGDAILANGADNLVITAKLKDKVTGQVDVNADNLVIAFNATYGSLANTRVTVQDGVASVTLTSEFSQKDITSKVTAEIIEASGDYKDLIGKVVGTKNVYFKVKLDDITPDQKPVLVSAESNVADRITLNFNKDVTVADFVQYNEVTKKFLVDDKENAVLKDGVTVKVTQKDANDKEVTKTVRGFKPVAGNSKALELILAKDIDNKNELTDNKEVVVELIQESNIGPQTSTANFILTDARKPEATSAVAEGLKKVVVKFSEPVADADVQLDGGLTKIKSVNFGDFNQETLEDLRDTAFIETETYMPAGTHSVQLSSIYDYAGLSDSKNISTSQTLDFQVAGDDSVPNATVSVESPEQFRVTFNKVVEGFALEDVKLQKLVKGQNGAEDKWVDVNDAANLDFQYNVVPQFDLDPVSESEYVLELKNDWTEIYNTSTTNKNYYNDQYRLVIPKEAVTNPANGKKNAEIVLPLNFSGSKLNSADTTSPVISGFSAIAVDRFEVQMSEPVKLPNEDNDDTASQIQKNGNGVPTPIIEFLGKDKDDNAVTIKGEVVGYTDENKADKRFEVTPAAGQKSLQDIVDEGGDRNWTLVVRSISDDVGNTAASLTYNFVVEPKAPSEEVFKVESVKGYVNGTGKDTIVVDFTADIQYTGTVKNAVNVSNYVLDGEPLPKGTIITASDSDDIGTAPDIVTITLPDGTLTETASHVITLSKSLESAKGTKLTGAYEISFKAEAGVEPADAAAAKAVDDQIAALPANLTLADEQKVLEARAAYVGLTDTQKALVKNLASLEAAEKKIADLKKAQDEAAANLQAAKDAVAALEAATAQDLTVEANLIAAEKAVTDAEAAVAKVEAGQDKDYLAAKVTVEKKKVTDARAAFDQAQLDAAKTALNVAITAAQNKADNAVAGTKVGNYPQQAIDDLKAAIATAKGVYDNAAATVQELKDAKTELDNAVKAFDDQVVEAVVTTVEATANPTEVTKPATGQTATVQITAKVKDQDGNEMTAEQVTYEVNAKGVSIDANGLLTVNDNASTGDVTVTVKSKTKNTVTTTVTVTIK